MLKKRFIFFLWKQLLENKNFHLIETILEKKYVIIYQIETLLLLTLENIFKFRSLTKFECYFTETLENYLNNSIPIKFYLLSALTAVYIYFMEKAS